MLVADRDQHLQVHVVAFRIDHAQLIEVLGEALDQAGRESRLAAAGRTRHQHVVAIRRQPYRRAVEPRAERDVPAREPRIDRLEIVRDQFVDQLDHAFTRRARRHECRHRLDRIDRVRDCDRTLGEAHEGMIVLRVAYRDQLRAATCRGCAARASCRTLC